MLDFKGLEDHGGQEHPTDDQINVKAVANGDEDEEHIKLAVEETPCVSVAMEELPSTEADDDGLAAMVAICIDPCIKPCFKNIKADFIAGRAGP